MRSSGEGGKRLSAARWERRRGGPVVRASGGGSLRSGEGWDWGCEGC